MFQLSLIVTLVVPLTCINVPLTWNELNLNAEVRGPEQVHISYGNFPSEMIVVWSTSNVSWSSFVTYGENLDNLNFVAKATDALLTEGNPNGLQLIHRAVMTVSLSDS